MECYSAIKRGRIPSCAGRWTIRLSEKSQTQANIMFSLICGIQGKKNNTKPEGRLFGKREEGGGEDDQTHCVRIRKCHNETHYFMKLTCSNNRRKFMPALAN
jgi:hypothetical protein